MNHTIYLYSIQGFYTDSEYQFYLQPISPFTDVIIISKHTILDMEERLAERSLFIMTYRDSDPSEVASHRSYYVMSLYPIMSDMLRIIPDHLISGHTFDIRYFYPLLRTIRKQLYERMVKRKILAIYQQARSIPGLCDHEYALPLMENLAIRFMDSYSIQEAIDLAHEGIADWYTPEGPGYQRAEKEFLLNRIVLSELYPTSTR